MDHRESICMSEYSYKDYLLYTSKDSQIFKALNKANPNSHPYVFKGYPESYLTDPLKQRKLRQELNSLWELRGKENILQIIAQHSRDKKVFIITQFCEGGSLAQQIKKEGKFSQQKSIAYIQQIINGFASIYQAQLIHRNLEPSSILNAGLELKIGDFSDSIKQNQVNLALMRQEIVGNVHYQPYEVLSSYRYSTKSDVYSIGAIFLCMLTGRPPNTGLNKKEILQDMNRNDINSQLSSFRNPKLSQFLKKTLQNDEKLRMSAEELIDYKFDLMPQLNKLKLYTFDDKDSILIEQQIGSGNPKPSPILQKISEVQRSKQIEQSMKILFKNFDISEKRVSGFDLKVSDEQELSKLYKDRDISIFIPTKIELPNEDSSMIDNLGLQHVESLSRQPSLGLPLRKQAGTNKEITNNTQNDLMKSQKLTKSNLKTGTMKHLSLKTDGELVSTNAGLIKDKQSKKIVTIEEKPTTTISIKDATSNEIIVIPALQFKEEKVTKSAKVQEKLPSTHRSKFVATERSNIKGPFTLRGRQNIAFQVGKPSKESRNAMIAGWLISQIDMFRFLNRVIYRIKKVAVPELSDLSTSLHALKTQILNNVKGLTCLSREDSATFKMSPQVNKIKEIVEQYESKNPKSGQFQGYQKLNKQTVTKISLLYNIIFTSTQFKEEQIKLLDYFVTLWQLISLLKRNNAQQFHNKSKIVQIIDSKECKLTIGHLFQLYDRMKLLKLL